MIDEIKLNEFYQKKDTKQSEKKDEKKEEKKEEDTIDLM